MERNGNYTKHILKRYMGTFKYTFLHQIVSFLMTTAGTNVLFSNMHP